MPDGSSDSSENSVKVYARIRKLMIWENKQLGVKWSKTEVTNLGGPRPTAYTFQQVFSPTDSNDQCFKSMIEPLCERVIKGFNAIVVAYGQTGSGKTYTLVGKPKIKVIGMLPRTLMYLSSRPEVTKLEVMGVEAFGRHVTKIRIYDLFDKVNQKDWPDKQGKTMMDPRAATRMQVLSIEDSLELVTLAHSNSHFAPTGKNPESSRGHIVFVIICTVEKGHDKSVSHFVVADLAGSEGESALTGDLVKGMSTETLTARRLEAGCINTGLSDLQGIFGELKRSKKLSNTQGIGLRRLLHPYINNKTFISVIFCLSPVLESCTITESTLRFATRVCSIKAVPHKVKVIKNWKKMVEDMEKGMLEQKNRIQEMSEREEELSIKIVEVFRDLENRKPGLGKKVFIAALGDARRSGEEDQKKSGHSIWKTFLAENLPEVGRLDDIVNMECLEGDKTSGLGYRTAPMSKDTRNRTNLSSMSPNRRQIPSLHRLLQVVGSTMGTLERMKDQFNQNMEEALVEPSVAKDSEIAEHSKDEAQMYADMVNISHKRIISHISHGNDEFVELYDPKELCLLTSTTTEENQLEDISERQSVVSTSPSRQSDDIPSFGRVDSTVLDEEYPDNKFLENMSADKILDLEALQRKIASTEQKLADLSLEKLEQAVALEDLSRKKLEQALHFAEKEFRLQNVIAHQNLLIDALRRKRKETSSSSVSRTSWFSNLFYNFTGSS